MEAAIVNNDLELFKASCPDDMRLDGRTFSKIVSLKRFSFIDFICAPNAPRLARNKQRLINQSCMFGNYEVFSYDALKSRYGACALFFAVEGGNIEILDKVTQNISLLNGVCRGRLVALAIEYKRHNMIEYLIQKGLPVDLTSLDRLFRKSGIAKYRDVIRFTHDLDMQRDAALQNDWGCARNECFYCNMKKKEMLSDYWIMESETFDSTVQWLPNEMIEDTLMLF